MKPVVTSLLLNLEVLGRVVFNVAEFSRATVQANVVNGSWGATVLTVRRSNNQWDFNALESATTLTASGITAELDTEGYAFLAVDVTTVAGAAAHAQITVCRKTEE